MLKLISGRAAAAIPVMFVVATIVFALLRISPGDPAMVLAGESSSTEMLDLIREELGLNKPLYEQYVAWLWNLLHGDLGTSAMSKVPVIDLILSRIEPTLVLAVCALALTVILAVPLGAVAAWFQNSILDRAIMALTVGGLSVPTFVVGYVLILWFSLQLMLFPVQGYVSPFTDPSRALMHLALPSLTLSLFYSALITRVTRASVLEVLNQDFVRTARAKGSSDCRLALRHVLPNAAVPIITVIGLSTASLVTGVVVTESVFNIPGVGRLMIDAILSRDYPIVQGLMLFFAAIYIVINLVIDVIYVLVNPRIQY